MLMAQASNRHNGPHPEAAGPDNGPLDPTMMFAATEENDMPQQTVLIVDDNPENLTVLGELLRGRYKVRAANSGLRRRKA